MKPLVLFTRQLAAMLRGGLPLVTCLQQLEGVFPDKKLTRAAGEIAQGLRQGYSFYHLLQSFPRLFPPFYLRMAEAGENGDSLLPVLDTLADYYHERELIKNRLARIMFYPVLLLAMAMSSGLLALWQFLPSAIFTPHWGRQSRRQRRWCLPRRQQLLPPAWPAPPFYF